MSAFANMDLGPSGGDYNGFLSWTSQGSDDGQIPRRCFSLNVKDDQGNAHRMIFQAAQSGMAIDTRKLQIGWEKNDKGMPKPHRVLVNAGQPFPASPGEGYRKALSIPVTSGDGKVYLWQQGGVTAFAALEHLVPQIAAQEAANPGKVPVVAMNPQDPTLEMQIQGKQLGAAKLTIMQWVDAAQFFGAEPSAVAGMQQQQGQFGQQQPAQGNAFGGAGQNAQAPAQAPVASQGAFGAPNQQQAQGGFGQQQAPATQPGAFAGGPVGQQQPEF